jgi:hypothetical protein
MNACPIQGGFALNNRLLDQLGLANPAFLLWENEPRLGFLPFFSRDAGSLTIDQCHIAQAP